MKQRLLLALLMLLTSAGFMKAESELTLSIPAGEGTVKISADANLDGSPSSLASGNEVTLTQNTTEQTIRINVADAVTTMTVTGKVTSFSLTHNGLQTLTFSGNGELKTLSLPSTEAKTVINADGNKITLSHSYCGSSNSNIASNEEIISYGVYRVTNPNQTTKATILAASKSALEADCIAYGSKGFYGGKICSENGFVIDDRCAHEELCEDCETYGICAGGSKDACLALAESNKLNVPNEDNPAVTEKTAFRCFTLMTKPTGGMGLITGSLIGDLGI